MWSRIWEVGDIFQIGNRKLEKRLQKILKKFIRASIVSIKKINKSLNRIEKFMKRFKIIHLRASTVRERNI